MAYGPGTYGHRVGRPSKKLKKQMRAQGLRGSPVLPNKKFRR